MRNLTVLKYVATLVLSGQLLLPATVGLGLAAANPVKTATDGHNAFAVDLYQTLGDTEGNLFFSPLSISIALSMTYAGARDETAAVMQQVLHLSSDPSAVHEGNCVLQEMLENHLVATGQLELANSLWPGRHEKLLESFVETLQKNYGAECRPLDYASDPAAAAKVINQWVAEKTHDRIVDLLQPGDITPDMRLVLVNAISFEGKWVHAFDPERTYPTRFNLADGSFVEVPGMTQSADFSFAQLPGVSVVELPFAGGNTSMVFAVPDAVDGLAKLEAQLTPAVIDQWLAALRTSELHLTLPRFEMGERVDLAQVLSGMGMAEAFGREADFSGMTGDRGLFIDRVIHQAMLKVHEEGAEAAAATAVMMKRASISPSLRVDRPFLFMIRHNETGSILFLGRLVDPRGKV